MARKKHRKKAPNRARRQARKRVPLGVLIWTALTLLILVAFLFNRAAIHDVVDRTELLTVLQRSVDSAVQRNQSVERTSPPPEVTRSPIPPATQGEAVPPSEAPRDVTRPQDEAATDPAPPSQTARPAARRAPPTASAQQAASPPGRVRRARQRRLFFAAVSTGGEIAVTGVTRTVDDTPAPLTDTLETLFAGPDPNELDQGLITMIPPAVSLHRVYVNEQIAYIDVSESFRFNPLGHEGLDAQLQQIVFSATEFPGVEMVQILIDGRRVNFLGPEGIYIGQPIGRATFLSDPPPTP